VYNAVVDEHDAVAAAEVGLVWCNTHSARLAMYCVQSSPHAKFRV